MLHIVNSAASINYDAEASPISENQKTMTNTSSCNTPTVSSNEKSLNSISNFSRTFFKVDPANDSGVESAKFIIRYSTMYNQKTSEIPKNKIIQRNMSTQHITYRSRGSSMDIKNMPASTCNFKHMPTSTGDFEFKPSASTKALKTLPSTESSKKEKVIKFFMLFYCWNG